MTSVPEQVVVFDRVSLAFDDHEVLRDLSFSVVAGELAVLLGASGAGKSVILKLILGLLKPDAGSIRVNGLRIDTMSETRLMAVRGDIGMLFQESALFDSLTVADNVGYRLYEETDMPAADVRRRIEEVLGFIRLEEYIDRMPSELSGGQRRRVAIASTRKSSSCGTWRTSHRFWSRTSLTMPFMWPARRTGTSPSFRAIGERNRKPAS